ncbi:hypothetical protein Pcinc_021123 [Petrolisthes cinctipes]|uniref:Uncharacterized protein n=1 Tax=Petrolisthes cinctipes TaxID=88211 RepID=A0AAE1FGK8_PETCI|nr:hypothetical protein Pcinc_021123 [Petrolisthes cinctipes]
MFTCGTEPPQHLALSRWHGIVLLTLCQMAVVCVGVPGGGGTDRDPGVRALCRGGVAPPPTFFSELGQRPPRAPGLWGPLLQPCPTT